MSLETREPLLSIRDLSVAFPTPSGRATAVNGLSIDLSPGKVLGLVGESGCGKSISSLAILGLVPPPGEVVSGEIRFQGQDLLRLPPKALQRIRGAQIALIPQDPLTSLNPVYTVGEQIMEVLQTHQKLGKAEAREKTIALLKRVRIPNAEARINDYPHQFSGGMRQRAMIAMALSCNPGLLIADEPTTALDVTVQAQILDLLKALQAENGSAILLITHDLGVVAEMCDEVAVMYAGRIVEQAPVDELFAHPRHPYTQGLLHSLPTPEKTERRDRLEPIAGQPPTLTQIPVGCAFAPRCPHRMDICDTAFPQASVVSPSHRVCCYLYPQPQDALPAEPAGASS